MGLFFVRVCKILLAALFLPLVVAVTVGFHKQLVGLDKLQEFVIWGVWAYTLMHLFLFKPVGFFHFWQKIISDMFRFSPTAATVMPQVIPVIPLLILLLLYIFNTLLRLDHLAKYFLFAAGFAVTMHVVLIAEGLANDDPDPVKAHYLFSIALVYIANILIVVLLLDLNFHQVLFSDFIREVWNVGYGIYGFLYRKWDLNF